MPWVPFKSAAELPGYTSTQRYHIVQLQRRFAYLRLRLQMVPLPTTWRFDKREAKALRWALSQFGVKVEISEPDNVHSTARP